ncbi:hypothetical protein ACHAQA_000813 [Verticillium albo-atrum]
MARAKSKKGLGEYDATTKLPPIEAYSFKHMMAKMEAEEDSDINADLDRIAEICARSRYSLSNQYEVHVAPHGSGAAFMASASSVPSRRQQQTNGPTLQAVTSDDERNMNRNRKRRSGGRRRSMAMGTLETIMSSSGSSEDGKSKKKSADELTQEVRGRAARQVQITQETSFSKHKVESTLGSESATCEVSLRRRKSSSFATAMIENTRQNPVISDVTTPRNSSSTLLSEPALPQTSMNHLEVRTEPEEATHLDSSRQRGQGEEQRSTPSNHVEAPTHAQGSLLGGLSGWMPTWSFPPVMGISPASAQGGGSTSHAEGSLRYLLKTDLKGKGVERVV